MVSPVLEPLCSADTGGVEIKGDSLRDDAPVADEPSELPLAVAVPSNAKSGGNPGRCCPDDSLVAAFSDDDDTLTLEAPWLEIVVP